MALGIYLTNRSKCFFGNSLIFITFSSLDMLIGLKTGTSISFLVFIFLSPNFVSFNSKRLFLTFANLVSCALSKHKYFYFCYFYVSNDSSLCIMKMIFQNLRTKIVIITTKKGPKNLLFRVI